MSTEFLQKNQNSTEKSHAHKSQCKKYVKSLFPCGIIFYMSFKEQDITPELAQKVGMEFASRMWGKRFQIVVTTHLNTKHLHCHFVINSVSFVDGKRLQNDEKVWFKFRYIADEVCKEYGLYFNPTPNRSKQSSYYYNKEKAGMPTRYSTLREVIDLALK